MLERTDATNFSSLKNILPHGGSPKHYRHALENDREDTEALLLGRVTHCAVYEPEEFAKRYAVMPNFHKGMKDDTAIAKGYAGGKPAYESWMEAHACTEVVPADLHVRAMGMAAALHSDPIAGPMIVGGFAEQSIAWTDPETGIECRGRVDHVNGRLSDLKTIRDIGLCERQLVSLKYYVQLAWYQWGLLQNGVVLTGKPALIFVENVAPYDVLVLEFEEEDLEAGRVAYRKALNTLRWCRKYDEWPGVAEGEPRRVKLPDWVKPAEKQVTLGGVAI